MAIAKRNLALSRAEKALGTVAGPAEAASARPARRPNGVVHRAPASGAAATRSKKRAASPERRPARQKPIQGVLFDLDGTLVDSLPLTFDALRMAVRPYLGRLVSDDEINALLGPPEPAILAQLVGPNLAPACHARYERLYVARLRRMAPFAGILPMLAECRREGLKLGVSTGRGAALAEQTLHVLRLRPRLDVVITGDDVRQPKPSPEGILRALDELALKPAGALWVGDSPLDIQAGRAARVRTVAALWGARDVRAMERAKPRFLCRTPEELRAVIRSQLAGAEAMPPIDGSDPDDV
jgi:HAD superfamily hydrolase (TIGR01509 family)